MCHIFLQEMSIFSTYFMFLVNFSWVQEQLMHHSARLGRSLKPISARIRTSGAVRTPLIFTISFAQRYKMDYGSTELSGFTVKAHQSSSARKITKTNSRISNRQYKKNFLTYLDYLENEKNLSCFQCICLEIQKNVVLNIYYFLNEWAMLLKSALRSESGCLELGSMVAKI
jgi:hypothetical protein